MKNISFYKNTFEQKGSVINITSVLSEIKNGRFKNEIETLRKIDKSNPDYATFKSKLPAVTFSGEFSDKRRGDHLKKYSGFIIFDIDKLETEEKLLLVEKLSKDSLIYSVWSSPSNTGIKFLVITDADSDEHKLYFQFLKNHFEKKHSLVIDKSGSDYTRLCYYSYDPELWLNESPVIINKAFLEENTILNETGISVKSKIRNDSVILPATFTGHNKGKGKNLQQHREIIKKIIHYLSLKEKTITGTYENWYRVSYAIANSFSYDVGLKYFLELCRLDKGLHDEQKSIKILQYAYANKIENLIKFSTIVFLAKEKGFDTAKISKSFMTP